MTDKIIPPTHYNPFIEPLRKDAEGASDSESAKILLPNGYGEKIDDWPEPVPLGEVLPPVPAFNIELLPASLRLFVQDTAERMGCPIEYVAVAAVVMLAAMTNRRAAIQPKRLDAGWIVVPNLWGIIIGEPGTMKTPAADEVQVIVRAIQMEWLNDYEEEKLSFAAKQEEAELQLQVWREKYKAASKANKELPPRPISELTAPIPRRLLTNDATAEKLHDLLKENPAGLTLVRDEMSGWIVNLSRTGREGERAFFLECHNGNGSFTMDRIGRGSVHVNHLCLSMLGTIQPDRLHRLFPEEFDAGINSDGLLPRFQLMVYPDRPRNWRYVDRLPNSEAIMRAKEVYRRLAKLGMEEPLVLKFSDEAQELFVDWLTKLQMRLCSADLPVILEAHLSKYRALMPKLALLFSLADGQDKEVGVDHARQAAAWCDYLEKHAERVYAARINPARAGAIKLSEKIKEGWKQKEGFFSVRDVYRNEWADLKDPEQVRAALTILEEFDWVREIIPDSPKNGRPGEMYAINPRGAASNV